MTPICLRCIIEFGTTERDGETVIDYNKLNRFQCDRCVFTQLIGKENVRTILKQIHTRGGFY